MYYSNAHEAVYCRETKLTHLKLRWVAVNNRGPYSQGQGGVPDWGNRWLMKVSLCGVGREEKRRKNIAGKTEMKEKCIDER